MVLAIIRTLAAAAWTFAAADANANMVGVGDLVIPFDPGFWRVEGEGARISLEQLGDRHGNLGIKIDIQAGSAEMCSQQAMAEHPIIGSVGSSAGKTFTLKRDKFDLHVATAELGCRNWTGSPVYACTFYRGRVYTFTADPGGCDTPPRYDEPVLQVLGEITAK